MDFKTELAKVVEQNQRLGALKYENKVLTLLNEKYEVAFKTNPVIAKFILEVLEDLK